MQTFGGFSKRHQIVPCQLIADDDASLIPLFLADEGGHILGNIECACKYHRNVPRSRNRRGTVCYVDSKNERLEVAFHSGQAIVVHKESV